MATHASTNGHAETKTKHPEGSESVETLRADIDALRSGLSELTRSLRQTGRDGAGIAAAEAKAAAGKAREAIQAGSARVGEAVKARPALACGVAIGVGALLGAAIARRR
ncbi:hypothetical protein L2U69_04505 [Zavarzinia compransoris]|uniref:hypothetical protein n=1 Tax=Zavarzinia marina TaxID=2911065 RepID=UPI001F1FB284|nr:hypothetical protein [Zavarzinia marina]MCF4164898.1 hypothetical protein [Zavarzinia marina]